MKIAKNIGTILIVLFCNLIMILSLFYAFGTIDNARYESKYERDITILGIEAEPVGEEYGCLFGDDEYHFLLKVRVRNDGSEDITTDHIDLRIYKEDPYRYFSQEYENKYDVLKSKEFVPEGKTGIITKVVGSTEKDGSVYVAVKGENGEEITYTVQIP